MKDEIKEILDIEKYRNKDGYVENISLLPSEIQQLLDYITNLQEEYEKEHYLVDKLTRQLTDEYKNTEYQCKQKEDYKSRNEKAIEKLESIRTFGLRNGKTLFSTLINESIDILQGEDKE